MGRERARVAHLVLAVCAVALAAGCGGDTLQGADPDLHSLAPTYSKHVRPLLVQHCVMCHAADPGEALGGVRLETYETAWGNAVRNACTSILPELVERYRDALVPLTSKPNTPSQPCGDWEVYSMPTGAQPRLTTAEQVILVRWVVTGGAR